MLQNATKYNFKQKSAKQLIKVERFVSNLRSAVLSVASNGSLIHLSSVVVAQSLERLLPTSEARGSNPAIGKIYIKKCLLSSVLKRHKIKKREAQNGPF